MITRPMFEGIVAHLRRRRRCGETGVALSDDNRAFLRDLIRGRTDTVQKQAPPATPPQQQTQRQQQTPASASTQVARPPDTPPDTQPAAAPRERQARRRERDWETPTQTADKPAPPPLDLADAGWDELRRRTAACERCDLCRLDRDRVVFGAGNEQADLMFIGHVPGSADNREGIPFSGEVGDLLTRIIQAMQFDRDEVYLTNLVKCHPPRERSPKADEIAACRPYLERQIQLVQPRVIVAMGENVFRLLTGQRGLSKNRGQWFKYHDIDVMPTHHPAFLRRKPESKRDVWDDMQKVMAVFGKQPPTAGKG